MHIDHAVTAEQARHLHRNTPIVILTNALGAAAVAMAFEGDVPFHLLAAWLVAFLLQTAYRLGIWQGFRRRAFLPPVARAWFRLSLLGSLFATGLWILGMQLFFTNGSFMQHFAFWCVTMLVGVASTFTQGPHYPRRFLLSYFPLVLPALAWLAYTEVICCGVLAAVLAFLLVLLFYARRFNKLLSCSLRLSFENTDLVAQLTRQKKIAEAANMAKSRFLAAASHDLRQPIHALSIHLQTLAASELPGKAQGVVRDASECCDSMNDLFSSLLDVSRLDSQAVQPLYSAFALQPLLDRIVADFRPQAQLKGVDLRRMPCKAWIYSDPTLVERILRNLVSNAVRYTDRGRVIIGCRHGKNRLRLGVYDSGLGIAPDQQGLIFEEFYQVNKNSAHSIHGLGLGLNIVQRLAHLLDTRISLRSRVGRGSAFSFELAQASPALTQLSPKPAQLPPFRPQLASLILIVGQGEWVARTERILKQQWQCPVISTESGRQAIDLLTNCTLIPCALICDATDSGKTIGLIREEFNQSIPALVIAPTKTRASTECDIEVLPEPLQINALVQSLQRLLAYQAECSTQAGALS